MVRSKYNGFTILELMVVVAVVGILAAVGVPAMRDILLSQHVKTAASDAHISLLYTRSESIKRNTDVEMASSNWANGWNVQVPGSPATIIRTQDPLNGLTVQCNTDTNPAPDTCPASITFNRTGRPDSTIELRFFINGNTKVIMRCVTISLSGVPKVYVDDDDDPTNGCS